MTWRVAKSLSDGGLLGGLAEKYMAETIDRDTAANLSTADLLRTAAPKKTDRVRLVEDLERRCLLGNELDYGRRSAETQGSVNRPRQARCQPVGAPATMSALAVAIRGKADMTLCSADVRF
jgi:hypothetical protein